MSHLPRHNRRRFLELGLWSSAALATGRVGHASGNGNSHRTPPFTLGIASGFPTSNSLALWTRLAPIPLAPDGGMGQKPVEVHWALAEDESFKHLAASGSTWATADYAHSVHVEPVGLQPARDYWYRFEAQGHRSPVGRTRTAAAIGSPQASLRAAVVSCQHYEHGEYAAYRHLAAHAPDLVLHLGDYIYENSLQRPGAVRRHLFPEAFTLEDYRLRYAQYKLDPALQAAHACCPWLTMWDDHEVENDYAGEVSQQNDPREWFLQRRAAAYRAYYEHMPVPRQAVPFGALSHLYSQRVFGDLASIVLLDNRQYRARDACLPPGRGGAIRTPGCPELFDTGRSMLGATQEAWCADRLKGSRARWNLLGQGTPMAWIDQDAGPEHLYWTDGWTGYPAARDRLMAQLQDTRATNPVILSGDVHAFGWSELKARAGRDEGPVIAPELITTSITSNAVAQSTLDDWPKDSPELKHIDGTLKGYLELNLSHARAQASLIAVDDPKSARSGSRVVRTLSLEAGDPAIHAGTSPRQTKS